MKAYQQFTLGLAIAVVIALLLQPVGLLISGQMPNEKQWGAVALCLAVFTPILLLFWVKKEIEPVSVAVVLLLTLVGVSWTWTHLPEPAPSAATVETMSYTPYSDEPNVSIIRTSTR